MSEGKPAVVFGNRGSGRKMLPNSLSTLSTAYYVLRISSFNLLLLCSNLPPVLPYPAGYRQVSFFHDFRDGHTLGAAQTDSLQ